ncbi:hypothetical protein ANCDUO_16158, partial [Ancylostoma duodenale]
MDKIQDFRAPFIVDRRNKPSVVSVLCARTNWQRQEIAKAFKVMYGKDLIK